jgi:hypothetical protein
MRREDEIRQRYARHVKRLERVYTAVAVIGLASTCVVLPVLTVLLYLPLRTIVGSPLQTALTLGLFVLCITLLLTGYAMRAWLANWGYKGLLERRERAELAIQTLRRLREEHPELVELDEVRAVLDDEKAQSEVRRGFWVNIAVSLASVLLGFALSYAATKLGWLR